ncbi:hypothetical protein [Erythrobacter sp. F6033]|uniref:hypothetical protein n=1 Tax=Erythrobacter sp. F6033 TaxID=2926401 RepID=UPI001FF22D35|nr:hypothetical protein [Erythrobacter sp. F6033]MCK0128708.1 hypothetical protein [Erythrobacter sp. F6033]
MILVKPLGFLETTVRRNSTEKKLIKRWIETIGEHPLATGLLALLGIGGFWVSIVGYQQDRSDARATSDQIETGFSETDTKIDDTRTSVESIKRSLEQEQLEKEGQYLEGTFLYEDPVEGVYSNFWTAYPIRSGSSPELTIRGEGKTVEFSGVIQLNCENGKYFWHSGNLFQEPLSDEEIRNLVPNQAVRAMVRIFCRF